MVSTETASGQLALAIAAQDKASFDNFWIGENSELVKSLQAMSDSEGARVTFVYGAPGAGKSHLLFATLRRAEKGGQASSFQPLSNPHVQAEMLEMLDPTQLVCLDDVHLWSGDPVKERAIFALFERIKHADGRLLVTATQPPEQSGFGLRDLVSRLSSGLIYPVHSLSDEQMLSALALRAEQRGLSVTTDVFKYLLSRMSRDTSAIFGLLDDIDRASLAEQRRVTIPFIQQLLKRAEDEQS
jgi:DnaA family protein